MQTHGSCFLLLQEIRKRLKSDSLSKAVEKWRSWITGTQEY